MWVVPYQTAIDCAERDILNGIVEQSAGLKTMLSFQLLMVALGLKFQCAMPFRLWIEIPVPLAIFDYITGFFGVSVSSNDIFDVIIMDIVAINLQFNI